MKTLNVRWVLLIVVLMMFHCGIGQADPIATGEAKYVYNV